MEFALLFDAPATEKAPKCQIRHVKYRVLPFFVSGRSFGIVTPLEDICFGCWRLSGGAWWWENGDVVVAIEGRLEGGGG